MRDRIGYWFIQPLLLGFCPIRRSEIHIALVIGLFSRCYHQFSESLTLIRVIALVIGLFSRCYSTTICP